MLALPWLALLHIATWRRSKGGNLHAIPSTIDRPLVVHRRRVPPPAYVECLQIVTAFAQGWRAQLHKPREQDNTPTLRRRPCLYGKLHPQSVLPPTQALELVQSQAAAPYPRTAHRLLDHCGDWKAEAQLPKSTSTTQRESQPRPRSHTRMMCSTEVAHTPTKPTTVTKSFRDGCRPASMDTATRGKTICADKSLQQHRLEVCSATHGSTGEPAFRHVHQRPEDDDAQAEVERQHLESLVVASA